MGFAANLDDFLRDNRISQEDWEKANCDWSSLQSIAKNYEDSQELLRETAEAFARIIQKFPAVHSVRWRVKDVNHLLEKIVRKKASGSEKYRDIGVDNYQQIVTDLVGIRAIHLFKDECFEIHDALESVWVPVEKPIAYFRKGDDPRKGEDQDLRDVFQQRGFIIEDHKAGYRSVHYVFASNLTQRTIHVELQVRTIFEEGWSEIDHRVRYPNYDSDPQVDYFLTIFNRTAGSADEMGTFVRNLAFVFQLEKTKTAQLEHERDDAIAQMSVLVNQLERAGEEGQRQTETIKKMRAQIANIERMNASARGADLVSPGLSDASRRIRTLASLGLAPGDSGLGNVLKNAEKIRSQIAKYGLSSDAVGIEKRVVSTQPRKKQND